MFRSAASRIGFLGVISPFAGLAFSDWQFDPKGFETHQKSAGSIKFEKPLILAGVGMRRKNLYLMELDVYLAAAALSPAAVMGAKSWIVTRNGTIADALLDTKCGIKDPQAVAMVTLRFVRDVGASSLKGAFNEILAGLPTSTIEAFTEQVAEAVGSAGVKTGDDVLFVWMEGGGLYIMCNGRVGRVVNRAVERQLLEGYLNPDKGVSPELRKCFADHISTLHD